MHQLRYNHQLEQQTHKYENHQLA
ncbi:hypothetical protein [Marinifilum fragile]